KFLPSRLGRVPYLRIIWHLRLRAIWFLNLRRPLHRLLQMRTQFFPQLLDTTIFPEIAEFSC
ncbi:MAG: hypothetical protein KDA80_14225, partial [Planctomycetaceae bacterium]|nr:hypothetical protein [Planctomycetaceae bacterium]